MNRKSEISTMFTMLLTGFVIFIILVFGVSAFSSVINFTKRNQENIFFDNLKKDIETAAISKGSKTLTYNVPSDVGRVLFIDTDFKDAMLTEDFIISNPRILDSLKSGEIRNMFILSRTNQLRKSFYLGDVEIAKLGSQECDGYAIVEINGNSLKLDIINRGFGKIVMGQECRNLRYWTFEYPFTGMHEAPGSAKLDNEYAKSVRLLKSPTVANYGYHMDGTFTTDPLNLNSYEHSLYRIYYDYNTPGNSKVMIRIGFMNASGDWIFKGKGIETHYFANGLAIDDPGFPFNNTKIEVTLVATSDQEETPSLRWIRVAYKMLNQTDEDYEVIVSSNETEIDGIPESEVIHDYELPPDN